MTPISTRQGKIRGFETAGSRIFLGVRYGQPPVAERRFKQSVMAESWAGVFDATAYPNRAVQMRTSEGTLGAPVGGGISEDCLFLNIYAPASAVSQCPVLVWFHGGGFMNGSANEYDGSVLAAQGDVVVVTVNSRLGPFGFLNLASQGKDFATSANNGIQDQILALQWIRENIEAFGADPAKVTIFGQSSGGSSVLGLLAAPGADALYHRVIAHSPTTVYKPSKNPCQALAAELGIEESECAAYLQQLPASDILGLASHGRAFSVDGQVITRSTLEAIQDRGQTGVPIMTGSNRDEGTLYSQGIDENRAFDPALNSYLATDMLTGSDPKPYLNALEDAYPEAGKGELHAMVWTDMFRRLSMLVAETASAAGPGGWFYRFDLPANLPNRKHLGSTHAGEMAFTFNVFENPNTHAFMAYDRNDAVVKTIGRTWSDTVMAMARTGEPNGGGMPDWPRYDQRARECLIVDTNTRVEADPDACHRGLWEA
ncbi:MAG: carboxylesterase/lipase family protein [Gammaproteobacteria bacterium TMED134]|nr:MAG: carboxylesterase/lipase family protein [Gammaproteobacteria bacterium TMED134]|tara:strand:- start:508 stop:1962 length:1455 start_codon:yes stop_codon:yes gene_type:complete